MRVSIHLQQMTSQILRVHAHAVVLIEQAAHDRDLTLTHGVGDAALMPSAAGPGNSRARRSNETLAAAPWK